jgi:deoxyadenosine/deoxycytidine kinase
MFVMDMIQYMPQNYINNKYSHLCGKIITIAGPPGVGKTRLCKDLAYYLNKQGLNAKHFKEYVNKDFLNLYLNNKSKYAFSFQVIMVQRRIATYYEAVAYSKTGGIAIIDGPINTDNAFELMNYAQGFISEEEHKIYLNMLNEYKNLPEPYLVIYLDCNTACLLYRLKQRNRPGEVVNYDENFYTNLYLAYSLAFSKLNVKMVSYNDNCELENGRLSQKFVLSILDKIINEKTSLFGINATFNDLKNRF